MIVAKVFRNNESATISTIKTELEKELNKYFNNTDVNIAGDNKLLYTGDSGEIYIINTITQTVGKYKAPSESAEQEQQAQQILQCKELHDK